MTAAIMSAGMWHLREKLGSADAQAFIDAIKQNDFDYTEWRGENLFEDMTPDELLENVAGVMREHKELVPKNAKRV